MINITGQGGQTYAYVMEFIADKKEDMESLNNYNCATGSTCFVISESSVYMKNSEGEWIQI